MSRTLDDLLKYTPNVSYGNNGPGQGEIFMRGLSNGFRGNQSTGTVGLYPNVAIYLDEQSMQFPARNVDIYMVDMQRVEVLEGPQGTLFGGGAEAGALRYITNKPDLSQFSGKAEVTYGITSGGAPNTSAYAVLNFPISRTSWRCGLCSMTINRAATSTMSTASSPAATWIPAMSCSASIPARPASAPMAGPTLGQQGGQGWCTLEGRADRQQLLACPAGTRTPSPTQGARISALYDINTDWNVLIGETYQKLDAEGLSVEYPIGSNFQTARSLASGHSLLTVVE